MFLRMFGCDRVSALVPSVRGLVAACAAGARPIPDRLADPASIQTCGRSGGRSTPAPVEYFDASWKTDGWPLACADTASQITEHTQHAWHQGHHE